MRNFSLRSVIAILLLLMTGACMSFFTTPFFRKFSLQELIQRNKSNGPSNCSSGAGLGGIGTGTGGGGINQSTFHRSESFSCQLTSGDQFDEASFIQALKEAVETDLHRIDANVVGADNQATKFVLHYSMGDINGRIEISGIKHPGNFYTVQADLQERRGEAK